MMTVEGKNLNKSFFFFFFHGRTLFCWNFFTCLAKFENDSALTFPSPSELYNNSLSLLERQMLEQINYHTAL